MSKNKFISYLLCNKAIIVNLYKLYFPSFLFSLSPNKRVFHSFTFPPFQPNTQEGKVNIFYPSTFPSSHNFPFSHFSIPLTKQTLNRIWRNEGPTYGHHLPTCNGWFLSTTDHKEGKLPHRQLFILIKCYHRMTNSEQLESCYIHLSFVR